MTTITAMTTMARSKIARAWGDYGLDTFTTSAINNAAFHSCMCLGFLLNRPRERQRSSQDSFVPGASQEWKNFRSAVEPALHTRSIAPEISRYSRARE